MKRRNQRVDFSTHLVVAISKCKQQPNIIVVMLEEIVQQIQEEVVMKEVDIPAAGIELIEEVVVAVEPWDEAINEVVKIEHPQAEEEEVELMLGVILDTNDQSADEESGVEVITASFEEVTATEEVGII